MHTPHVPLTDLDLRSLPLTAACDIANDLQLLADTLGPGIPDLQPTLTRLLADLDTHLIEDPLSGHDRFVATADTLRDVLDRHALLRMCEDLTVPVSIPTTLPGHLPAPQPKRAMTAIETLLVRHTATGAGPIHAGRIAGLESGGTPSELADTHPRALGSTGRRFTMALAGTAHIHPRTVRQPQWADGPLAQLATRRTTRQWLLHNSRSSDPQARISCLLMGVRKLLHDTGLPTADTLTADSIRRTGLRDVALHGGRQGWDRALSAAGYRNADAADRYLALHEDL